MRVGKLPLIPYFRPGDKALALEIAKHASRHAAVLLANHGPVVSGKELDSAMYAIEELEETAKLMLSLHGHKIRTLTESQIQELKETFGAVW
jgi:ribulose-5-phosphate 4-epimerase/fuculose-1-phosphate aldolase